MPEGEASVEVAVAASDGVVVREREREVRADGEPVVVCVEAGVAVRVSGAVGLSDTFGVSVGQPAVQSHEENTVVAGQNHPGRVKARPWRRAP